MGSELQARPTVAEIDGRALADNFAELGRIAGSAGMLPVVKSDAYGHGLALVGRVLRDAGAERFAVATAAEGRDLRAASVQGTIVVLGGVYPADFATVVESRLAPVVWEAETARGLAAAARAAGRVVSLHVKVDTGMSRLGVAPADTPALLQSLGAIDGVTVEGLLTHFCNAESVEGPETTRQLARFTELVRALAVARLKPRFVHAANSAATLVIARRALRPRATGNRALRHPPVAGARRTAPASGRRCAFSRASSRSARSRPARRSGTAPPSSPGDRA